MIIQCKKVWIADQFMPAQIEMEGGKIVAVGKYDAKPVDADYGDKRIIPGMIDVHCHGAYEFDTNYAEEEGLRNWAKNIVSEGVTAFLATTITQSEEVLTKASESHLCNTDSYDSTDEYNPPWSRCREVKGKKQTGDDC